MGDADGLELMPRQVSACCFYGISMEVLEHVFRSWKHVREEGDHVRSTGYGVLGIENLISSWESDRGVGLDKVGVSLGCA